MDNNLYSEFKINPLEAYLMKMEQIATSKRLHSKIAEEMGIQKATVKKTLKGDLDVIKRLIAITNYIERERL